MKTFYSDDHRLHFPRGELYGGEMVTPFERPPRMDYVLERLKDVGMGDTLEPDAIDMASVGSIHDADYLKFLETAYDEWKAAGFGGDVIAASFPARRQRQKVPNYIDGKAGYYALAIETAITKGTWQAAKSACAVAQSAQRVVSAGERTAFAMCRPPGHHATSDQFGGYCFLNNAAVAAQMFLDDGAKRVAVLDIDFHHGNGTQDIFYRRSDVLYCSLHGEPENTFPYFLGYADETGEGEGEGFNANYPLPAGSNYVAWSVCLDSALARIAEYAPDALVISLGVDTFKEDPISTFKLESEDYLTCGKAIAGLGLPTLFVMEGGYAIEEVGINTVNVLQGFLDE
ncbi:MAG: histone deacetylase family protein [Alphaproteobacteria bacterium]